MPKFRWSQSERRYEYASNGRAVPASRIRDALQSSINRSKEEIGKITERLIDGKINTAEWTLRMRDEIRAGHRAAAMLANGGKMTPSQLGRLGATLRAQYDYLSRFSAQIDSGSVTLDGRLAARAKMYAQAIRVSYENQVRAREQGVRRSEERRVLNAEAESCSDCIAYAAVGWVPAGTLPAIADSICLSNCHCHFEFRD